MIRTGGVALGNLTLDTSRSSGFYPDIVMGYPEPPRQLRRMGVIESQPAVEIAQLIIWIVRPYVRLCR